MTEMEELKTKLENVTKSRDEFKRQVTMLTETASWQSSRIEEQQKMLVKLIDSINNISKAVRR